MAVHLSCEPQTEQGGRAEAGSTFISSCSYDAKGRVRCSPTATSLCYDQAIPVGTHQSTHITKGTVTRIPPLLSLMGNEGN